MFKLSKQVILIYLSVMIILFHNHFHTLKCNFKNVYIQENGLTFIIYPSAPENKTKL